MADERGAVRTDPGAPRPALRRPVSVLLPPPPQELAALLARLDPGSLQLYRTVRATVDELERAVSWGLLYYPPDDVTLLAERLASLAVGIRRLGPRLAECLPAFPAEESTRAGGGPLREEVEFYFETVLQMVDKDLARLEAAVAGIDAGREVAPERIERLCELAADLKGKFESSIMGATASLVSQGRWPSLATEPVLFPEKAEESRRTHELAVGLRAIVAALAELPDRVPLVEIVARWREGQRADQYAFADLVVLRGQLGALLRERGRRALYSGDYHQIRQREVRLAERVSELEWLHRRSWSVPAHAAAEFIGAELPRLELLLAEIAALIDVEQLKLLIGEAAVQRLRAPVAAGQPREPLAHLLAHDDLKLFFDMLHGAVQRRAALASGDQLSGRQPLPTEVLAQMSAAAAPRSKPVPAPAAPSLSPARQEALVTDLRRRLTDLQSPQNARWIDFRMVLRMLSRHGRLPDAMVRASLAFVEEVLVSLVPDLRRLTPYGGLTRDLVDRLEGTCRGLLAEPGSVPGTEASALPRLERLQRFLDALQAALGSH